MKMNENEWNIKNLFRNIKKHEACESHARCMHCFATWQGRADWELLPLDSSQTSFPDSCAIAMKQVTQQEKFQTCLDSISLRRNVAPIPICGAAERASWTSWTSWTKMASENAQIPSWTGWSFMPRLLHPALDMDNLPGLHPLHGRSTLVLVLKERTRDARQKRTINLDGFDHTELAFFSQRCLCLLLS